MRFKHSKLSSDKVSRLEMTLVHETYLLSEMVISLKISMYLDWDKSGI